MQLGLPILTIVITLTAILYYFVTRTKNDSGYNEEEFLERELRANSVRRQPLDNLDYIKIDLGLLDDLDTNDSEISSYADTLSSLSEAKIVNLSGLTNTDLKLKYGPANLNDLTEFDHNFNTLCRTLNDLAVCLNQRGEKDKAIDVLEFGIKCNTDLKSHYLLLADLYEEKLQYKKIVNLIKSAENMNSLLKNSLIKELNKRLENTGFSPNEEIRELEDIRLPDKDVNA